MFQLSSSLLALSAAASVLASPLSTNSQTNVGPHRPKAMFSYAPMYQPAAHHPIVNNSYMVKFKSDIPDSVFASHFNFLTMLHAADPLMHDDAGLRHVYDTAIKGYAGMFTDDVIEQIRQMPEVDYVERDSIVTTMEHATEDHTIVAQKGAPWGLARISHRPRLTLGTFRKYEYAASGGEGVDVYIVDTGINIDHVDFEGRAIWGKTIPKNDLDIDGNGHGTHCAGTIGSKTYGVAKKATVIAVKVLGTNGSGTMSDVTAGVDWVSKAAKAKMEKAKAELAATGKTNHKGSVANMSLGGGKSNVLDEAVNNAVKNGVHFAVAAGNDNKDACDYSPAAALNAVTVGASTLTDERAYFSNHGPCVDVFAPGLNILSTFKGSPTAVETLSGTSMASPHVAGLLAYYLSIYPGKTFNPDIESVLATDEAQKSFSTAYVYAIAYASLPQFISSFLPPPSLLEAVTAPVPLPIITTTQLKAAVISLSSDDMLSELPPKTVNKLVFNNATHL